MPSYDGNFNQTTSIYGATFVYNPQNQLVGESMQATYDGLGRCVRRTVGGVTTLFTYDDWNPILEWGPAGDWRAWNIYGGKPDEILARHDATHGPLIYKHDRHGSVTFVLNGTNQIVEKYTYDAYGTPKVTDGAGNPIISPNGMPKSNIGNRFMFTGREYLTELALYDYRHRIYDPGIGRFLQVDPTGFEGGDMNLFRYCADDPVDLSDPDGLYAQGAGWKEADWKKFDAAQKQAATALEKAVKITEDAMKGGKGSEAVKSAFEKAFGKGTATKENLAKVAETMKKMASALRDTKTQIANALTNKEFIKNGWGASAAGHAWANGKGIDINVQHPSFKDGGELKWTAAHESGHNFGLHDYAQKEEGAIFRSLPPEKALKNSDTVVDFALTQ